jgi:peptidoglycan/LPS O-acetylase OafA/YrhL
MKKAARRRLVGVFAAGLCVVGWMKSGKILTMRMRYRPDIDGLRALAVMAVMLFHTFPRVLPGGFVGVDIFFVISGYLISRIVLSDLDNHTFSATAFYAHRIRRIFPALVIVLIVTFALGWRFLLPTELVSLCKNIVASALFSANLMLLSEVGYFDLAAHMKPLLHLWSLGIEEQFYLVWPWILLLLPKRWLTTAMIAMIAASFALNVAMVRGYPSETFYLPFTRAWELLAGALLTQIPVPGQRTNGALGICGLSAVVASFFLFDAHTAFPGWTAALPVIGTAMLIASEGSFISRLIFTHRTAVKVGLISYPLYLWHWPLLVFAEIYKFRPLTDIQRGLVIGVTFVLAWLTYKLLEQPIRLAGNAFVRPLIVSMAALAIAAMAPSMGYVPALPAAIAQLATPPANGIGWRVHECMLAQDEPIDFPSSCVDQKRPLIAIWGDSTASALIPGMRRLQQDFEFGIAQYTISSCPPLLIRTDTTTERCIERNQKVVERLGLLAPDIVLLHAFWDASDTVEQLRPTIEALRAQHISRIVILGPVPIWYGGLPHVVVTYFVRTGNVIPERIPSYFDRASGDDTLRRIAAGLNVEYISARDVLCNSDGCMARIGDALVTSDAVHLTTAGSEFLAKSISANLKNLLRSETTSAVLK